MNKNKLLMIGGFIVSFSLFTLSSSLEGFVSEGAVFVLIIAFWSLGLSGLVLIMFDWYKTDLNERVLKELDSIEKEEKTRESAD